MVANAFAFGSSLLALWLVCRYPSTGPSSLRGGLLLLSCALILLVFVGPSAGAVRAAAGAPAALLLVLLPMLTFAFWAAAHLLRLYVAILARHGQ